MTWYSDARYPRRRLWVGLVIVGLGSALGGEMAAEVLLVRGARWSDLIALLAILVIIGAALREFRRVVSHWVPAEARGEVLESPAVGASARAG